jgi:hypothetical protein
MNFQIEKTSSKAKTLKSAIRTADFGGYRLAAAIGGPATTPKGSDAACLKYFLDEGDTIQVLDDEGNVIEEATFE